MTAQTLRLVLEQDLKRFYNLTPQEANGLFRPDALDYWSRTGLAPETVLAQTCGKPERRNRTMTP